MNPKGMGISSDTDLNTGLVMANNEKSWIAGHDQLVYWSRAN